MSHPGARMLLRPAIVGAVIVRPHLWPTAVRQMARLAPKRWWARAPFLPVPRADYLEFRLVTQYGGGHGVPGAPVRPADVVDYLEWCREWTANS
jgi:hypothetical protein